MTWVTLSSNLTFNFCCLCWDFLNLPSPPPQNVLVTFSPEDLCWTSPEVRNLMPRYSYGCISPQLILCSNIIFIQSSWHPYPPKSVSNFLKTLNPMLLIFLCRIFFLLLEIIYLPFYLLFFFNLFHLNISSINLGVFSIAFIIQYQVPILEQCLGTEGTKNKTAQLHFNKII